MAVDYAERLEDVHLILASEFGVSDREAVELLIASRLEHKLPYPWLIVETHHFSLHTKGSWYEALGDRVTSLASWRIVRPRYSNDEMLSVLRSRDVARTFIEPNWEVPPRTHCKLTIWPYLLQECVRIRTGNPRCKLATERSILSLRAALKGVEDPRWRQDQSGLPQPPDSLPYYAELLQRLSPELRSWESLVSNLCAIAGRRAYMFNRPVDASDWAAVGRVMRDSVPYIVADILGHLRSQGRLRSLGKYTPRQMELAVHTLAGSGILYSHKGDWYVRDKETVGEDIQAVLRGVEF